MAVVSGYDVVQSTLDLYMFTCRCVSMYGGQKPALTLWTAGSLPFTALICSVMAVMLSIFRVVMNYLAICMPSLEKH